MPSLMKHYRSSRIEFLYGLEERILFLPISPPETDQVLLWLPGTTDADTNNRERVLFRLVRKGFSIVK